jgi:anhydro-N-acetylmuramic acid kinase
MDWALFRPKRGWRALLNIGGIGNVSVVGPRLPDTIAFDTGPGNMLMDALARRATSNQLRCDLNGELSSRGAVLPAVLEELLRHPFLALPPPKSGGRENFGEEVVNPLWERHADRPFDLIATVLQFSVETIAVSLERWILPTRPLEAGYVSGGGSRNPALMRRLTDRLAPTPVRTLDALGFPEGAKEAACFALLASETLADRPSNVPSATGASHPAILGKRVP